MQRLLILLGLVALLCSDAHAVEWLTNLDTAMTRAQKENKAVLLDFTGSDWCPWCQKLKSEVFDRFEFAGYAAANLVMVEVDFPRRKQLNIDQLNTNYALASKYAVEGYPTIILLNAEGRVLGRCGYVQGGPTAFVARIERFPGMPHKGRYLVAAPASSPLTSGRPSRPNTAPQPAALPPPQYGPLALKGLSGVGNRRCAVINNETLMAGESASVRSFGTNVAVTLKEIRATSVVVVVEGQTRELSLTPPAGKP